MLRRTDGRETNGKVSAMFLLRLRLKSTEEKAVPSFFHTTVTGTCKIGVNLEVCIKWSVEVSGGGGEGRIKFL